MKRPSLLLAVLLLAAAGIAQKSSESTGAYRKQADTQQNDDADFRSVVCFAGQVRVRGKRVAGQPVFVFLPNGDRGCCGALFKSARTDQHGHFVIEPMPEGDYFAQFEFKGLKYVAGFAVDQPYERCSETAHVEINFLDVNRARMQSYADIDDSGEECEATAPNCFRK